MHVLLCQPSTRCPASRLSLSRIPVQGIVLLSQHAWAFCRLMLQSSDIHQFVCSFNSAHILCRQANLSNGRPTVHTLQTSQASSRMSQLLQVCQAWDATKFNFSKALQQEVLFQFEAGLPNSSLTFIPASPARTSPSLVFINVSPIEYGHILLVPSVLDQLTQLVDQASMRLALQFCEHTNNPYFRMCYNSLGAYGTINHLHFQVLQQF